MKVNEKNLEHMLYEIQKRADHGQPMMFSRLCLENHLGCTVRNRLKYALLVHVFDYPDRALGPSKKMYVSRDGKIWKFHFKDPYGLPGWSLTKDLPDIMEAMKQCPPEIADPTYHKKKSQTPIVVEPNKVEETKVSSALDYRKLSTDELTAMAFKASKQIEALKDELKAAESVLYECNAIIEERASAKKIVPKCVRCTSCLLRNYL